MRNITNIGSKMKNFLTFASNQESIKRIGLACAITCAIVVLVYVLSLMYQKHGVDGLLKLAYCCGWIFVTKIIIKMVVHDTKGNIKAAIFLYIPLAWCFPCVYISGS